MKPARLRAILFLALAAALLFSRTRRWLADVLSVTAHHLDHGPDVEPPDAAIERARRGFAGFVADALIQRGREGATDADEHRHRANGHDGPI